MQPQMDYVLRTVEERGVRFVRLWFTDVLGFLKSFAITPAELESALEEGMTFDGSSIEGYSRVQESDMLADARSEHVRDRAVARRRRTGRPHVLRHPEPLGRAVRRRPPLRAEAQPRPRAREGLHLLHEPRHGVLLLPLGRVARAARPRRLLRPHPRRHGERPAQADDPHARGDGDPGGVQLPRARPESARDRPALHRRAHDGRQRDDVPLDREAGRAVARCVRDVHAEADPGRVRLRDAHAPLACSRAT